MKAADAVTAAAIAYGGRSDTLRNALAARSTIDTMTSCGVEKLALVRQGATSINCQRPNRLRRLLAEISAWDEYDHLRTNSRVYIMRKVMTEHAWNEHSTPLNFSVRTHTCVIRLQHA